MISKNKYHSYNLGPLATGCKKCVRGEKMVLFVTGICPRHCYFCPVSDDKMRKDFGFANERKINSEADMLLEAHNMDARGAGITGGDPLIKLERTCGYIKTLKKKYGKKFHTHLYTSLNLATEGNLRRLHESGLDEIRFHPDLDSKKFWPHIINAMKFPWEFGIEIPIIPKREQETKELIDYIHDKVQFLNINELEIADNSSSKLSAMGYCTTSRVSHAVLGSLELGLRLVKYSQEKGYALPIHLCTAKLKDSIQLARRLKREGKKVKQKFDIIDNEGLLTRGALYLPLLVPGFGYRKKLNEANKQELVNLLRPLFEKISHKFSVSKGHLFIDEAKPRILLSKKLAIKEASYFKRLGLVPAIVTEYPTADQLEIEVEVL